MAEQDTIPKSDFGGPESPAGRPRFRAFWRRSRRESANEPALHVADFPGRLAAALRMPMPETPEWARRVMLMERDIVLPVKLVGLPFLMFFLWRQAWFSDIALALNLQFAAPYFLWAYGGFFLFYAMVNTTAGIWLVVSPRPSVSLLHWVPFAMALLDGLLVSMLVLVTGGYSSVLYWLYTGLIVRSAISVPRGTSQVLLNLTITACYTFTGYIDMKVAQNAMEPGPGDAAQPALSGEYPLEPVFLRLLVLLLMTLGCYAVPVLLERQRRIEEVAREVAAREGALRSAGRLAAEFAHQIKNPLAIINTAVFSLKRTLRSDQSDVADQVQMIQEEVERADRLITEVMGYAQLAEGHVEELKVAEELERALDEVFPRAARYPIEVHRNYLRPLPPLLMQRRHASEIFVNLLQNAREALDGKGGNIFVAAHCLSDASIQVSIADDGPGIPADKQERIFEAYFTTKEKGTGLGLATAKHNVELYGGRVRVESELGKGARFILTFPAKTLTKTA